MSVLQIPAGGNKESCHGLFNKTSVAFECGCITDSYLVYGGPRRSKLRQPRLTPKWLMLRRIPLIKAISNYSRQPETVNWCNQWHCFWSNSMRTFFLTLHDMQTCSTRLKADTTFPMTARGSHGPSALVLKGELRRTWAQQPLYIPWGTADFLFSTYLLSFLFSEEISLQI